MVKIGTLNVDTFTLDAPELSAEEQLRLLLKAGLWEEVLQLESQQFHLGGAHDQKTHGRGGGASAFLQDASHKDYADMYAIPGVHVFVTSLLGTENMRMVTMNLTDEDGELIGRMERKFAANPPTVHHELFTLNADKQGEGIAAQINKQAEEKYREAGFKEIKLAADISIGKYAWARQGYDFKDSDRTDMVKYYREAAVDAKLSTRQTRGSKQAGEVREWVNKMLPDDARSWQVAALDDGRKYQFEGKEVHLGKLLMLQGPSWQGVKNLDPASESSRVGEAYFQAKTRK